MTDRREFLQNLAALVAATPFAPRTTGTVADTVTDTITGTGTGGAAAEGRLIGVQMGAHTMLDEGIEPALDLCRETAGIDALFTYSHAYGGDVRKPIEWLAPDHGKPPIDLSRHRVQPARRRTGRP